MRARVRKARIVVLLALVACPVVAAAGVGVWTTNGPEGASITTLAVDPQNPSRVLAGTPRAGIFESTDAGRTWSFLGLPGQSVSAIVFDHHDSSQIFVTAGSFLWRTRDRGRTWAADSAGLPQTPPPAGYGAISPALSAPAFDTSRPGVAYVGWSIYRRGPYSGIIVDGGLLRTFDGGATWAATGLAGVAVGSISVDPGDPSVLYAVIFRSAAYYTPGSIVKSRDGGATWSDVLTGQLFAIDYIDILVDSRRPGWLYASSRNVVGGSSSSFLRSVDGGVSWSPFASSLDGQGAGGLKLDPADSDVFYANTNAGLARSRDGGLTWTSVFGTVLAALAIADTDDRRLYGGLGNGVAVSADSGATWQSSHAGLVATAIPLLLADQGSPSHLYAVDEHGALLERRDAGSTWIFLSKFADVPRSLSADPSNTSVLWAGDPGCLGATRSADAGQSFAPTALRSGCIGPLAFEPANSGVVYAPNSYASLSAGVFKSVNGGESWALADGGQRRDALVVAIDPLTPQTLYQGRVFEGVFKSTDGGGTWTSASAGLPIDGSGAIRVQAILVDSKTPAVLYAALGTGGVFKSEDAGAHWSSANSGLVSGNVFALVAEPTNPRRIYAATDGGVFVTSDGGASWSSLNEGLTNLSIRSLVIDPFGRLLHAATLGGGVFDIEIVPARSSLELPARRHPQARPIARP